MAQVAHLWKWKFPHTDDREEIKEAMITAMRIVDDTRTSPMMTKHVADEYMLCDEKWAWPVWQSLALSRHASDIILRQLHEKRLWYLDIYIVQHPNAPEDLLQGFVDLPKEIVAAHRTYKGYDKNKELRVHARRQLGLPPEEEEDEQNS
jgi:hypothetical protein